ncbi:elongation factor P [Mycoplasma miroungirhinis]|uniref:Elongation factor P n=1 Tax=Mycoplasma miroungirhinis TaxID=754516 RepID=A0A6M4JAV2_9MOLU|nr:elongation factor P [Mycoplasma miroungirhinis]QJR44124.1 elongation factor P [Mycoplasma miroungirhinis]
MINVNEFKPGITFEMDGNIYVVLESQHSKQGRGQATVKAKVKDLRSGSITIKSWTGGDKVKPARIEKTSMNFLYSDGVNIILMDQNTFEQVEIAISKIEWEMNFLVPSSNVLVRKYEQEILDIELAPNVELKVTEAPEAVKGNTTNNPQKKVTTETGFIVETPMFIKEGETILVSTETGKYVGRANK